MNKLVFMTIVSMMLFVGKNYGADRVNVNYDDFNQVYGDPLVVFTKTDPWLMVIGSDTPSFALYETGQLVYKYKENNVWKNYYIILNSTEMADFINYLDISEEIYDLNRYIELDTTTDQPYNILFLNIDKTKLIYVYGNLDGRARKEAPQSFLDIYDKVLAYKNDSAILWFPPQIEIMFSEWPNADKKRAWIEGYPDLESEMSELHGDIYSVYLDIKYYTEFMEYFESVKKNREAVEINGKTMVLRYRFPFPRIDYEPSYNK